MQSPTRPILLTALLSATVAGAAQRDLPVYGDSLVNGFQDQYWTSHTLTTTMPVHSGIYCISVTPTSSWEGIYLHHADFDSTPYASVSFWVNGGSNGGQRLQVQGLLGKANPSSDVYHRLTLLPDTWQKVTVPLASLGVARKTNFSGIWIQLTPGGTTNSFYVDDVQFDADTAAASLVVSSNVVTAAEPASETGTIWSTAAWCIAGTLVVITALLAWLILMLRRSGLGTSQALMPMPAPAVSQIGFSSGDGLLAAGAERRAPEAVTDPEARLLREKMALELAEFAKQSLVQGLYSQRSKLLDTQQKAQAELAELEARLASLHLPFQERIRAYEARIVELEKQLETRDEEIRNMTHATLLLVRERLEKEKAQEPIPGRFN
jgi:hypothetical protein